MRNTITEDKLTNTFAVGDKMAGDAPTARTGLALCHRVILDSVAHWVPARTRTVHQCLYGGRPWARDTLHATPPQRQDQSLQRHAFVTNMVAEPVCWNRRSTKQRQSFATRTRSRVNHRSRKDQTESLHRRCNLSRLSWHCHGPKDSAINEQTGTDAKTHMKDLSSQNERRSWKLFTLFYKRHLFRNESRNRWWHWHATCGRSRSSRILKTTQHVANTHVQQVVNTVEVKSLKNRQDDDAGRRLIQTTINLAKINQVIKQVEIPQIQYSAEADHQSFENHAASLEHARTSRRLCISGQDQAANRRTNCEHARPARRRHSEDGTSQDHQEHRAEKEPHPGEEQSGAMQSQVHSIQAVQKPWKSNWMTDVPVDTQRQMPTMQKVQNTKVVNSVKISQVDEAVRYPSDRADAGAEDADRTKGTPGYTVWFNRPSPQESPSAERSTSRGESADKEKTHDEQSRAAPEETVPEEMEGMKAPPDMKTGRSMRTCLSRVRPADHEARSQVKDEEAAAERKQEDGSAEFKSVGKAARGQCNKGTSE